MILKFDIKIKKSRSLAAVLVLSVLLLVSFSILIPGTAAQAPAKFGDSENKDTVIVAIRQDIESLNMFDPGSYLAVKTGALGWCYDTLMSYTPDLQVYLNMAESYTIDTPDGLNVTVHLRHGIKFSDGVEMTADDVVFTYDVLAYNVLYSNNLNSLLWPGARWKLYDGNGTSHVGVEKIDKYTVTFHLYKPYPLLFQVILNQPIIPLHIWKNHVKSAGTGDSDDVILDYSFGSNPSQGEATIGTGPFKFVEWKYGAYVVFERNENYWGKDFTVGWEGKDWPIYPQHVKRLVFKVYNSADTAVLALQKGEVHLTDIPVGYYKSLKLDPHVGISIITGDNFYFMPFNMRRSPMNDLNFRVAVAHAIDRDYIVTTLSQGFATKGTVPLAIISGAYINTSAKPPEFDLEAAKHVLDNAGYKDVNGDGWREAPGGRPLKLSIYSPTKDYEPIMADIGIVIQNDLRKIGLNVINTPMDFGTLVSKMIIQVDFDMLVMGYSTGSPFPETYLKMFFYSKYASPVGNNMAGYSNPEVDKLLDEIDHEMDTQKRIKMIKDLQGILIHDLPWVTLCYRKFLVGYRKDVWEGWVQAYAGLMNIFSIGALHHPSGVKPPHPGPATEISEKYDQAILHVYLPDAAYAGKSIKGFAYVSDANGVPIPEVSVQIYSSTGYAFNGTTDQSGGFRFSIPLPFQKYDKPVIVNYSMSVKIGEKEYSYTGGQMVRVYLPKNAVLLSLSMDKQILAPGESATIRAKVTNLLGEPLKDVNVTVLTEETLGSITPHAVTNDEGVATLEYTAPTAVINMNMMDSVRVKISVPNTILTELQEATLLIPIQSEGHGWYKVTIESVSSYALIAGQSAEIKARLTDAHDEPVASHEVYIQAIYSTASDAQWNGEVAVVDNTNVSFDAEHKTTDSSGEVTFTMTAVKNINRPYIVRVYTKDTYSVFDSVEIYVGNATGFDPYIGPWAANYGMDISITPAVTGGNAQVIVKLHVYNTNGTPAANVSGFFGLFATDYGAGAAWPDDANRIYNPFLGDYYSFTTDANGEATVVAHTNLLIADQPVYVDAWVDPGIGAGLWLGARFEYPYLFGVKEGFVLTRAPMMALTHIDVERAYLSDTAPDTNVTFTVVDSSGPLANATLDVQWKLGPYSKEVQVSTDSSGIATVNLDVPLQNLDGTVSVSVHLYSGDHTIGANSYDFRIPYLYGVGEMENLMVVENITVEPNPVQANSTATITLKFAGGILGEPAAHRRVTLSVDGGSLDASSKLTDSEGNVKFTYTAPDPLLSQHYAVKGYTESGASFEFGITVIGRFANVAEVKEQLQKIPQLTQELSSLQSDYNALKSNYTQVKNERNQATSMEHLFLALFVVFLIVSPVMYIVGKKRAQPKIEEEPVELEVEEEITEETEGEEPEEEEKSEEE